MKMSKRRLFFEMGRAQVAINRYVRDQLRQRDLGISVGQMGILFLLRQKRDLTMGDISGELDVDNAAATRLVDGLVAKKLVERTPDPDDRRRWRVALAPAGSATAAQAKEMVEDMNRQMRSLLNEHEQEVLIQAVQKLYRCFRDQ